jgi:hypothetical protein
MSALATPNTANHRNDTATDNTSEKLFLTSADINAAIRFFKRLKRKLWKKRIKNGISSLRNFLTLSAKTPKK